MNLPPPAESQAFCDVSVLEAGFLELPLRLVLAGETEVQLDTPALAFLIRHPSGKTVAFDLGIRKDFENLPPAAYERLQTLFNCRVPQDVADSLAKGGLKPADIDYVMYSHLHWDHVGDSRPFTKATFVLGGESWKMCTPGYPGDPTSTVAADLLPEGRTRWVWAEGSGDEEKSSPLGPFPRALDFFGDGSLWLVDTPGHCPGAMNVMVRTSADGAWVYLAGDSLHHHRLLDGAPMAHPENDPSKAIMYHDKPAAVETIRRIRAISQMPRATVILAHDKLWLEEHKDRGVMFPGKITPA